MSAVLSEEPIKPKTYAPAADELDQLIAALCIDQIPGVIEKGSDDPEIAIHEFTSRDVILWGRVLEAFLRAYHAKFPIYGYPIDPEALEEMLEIAFDERTQPLTRHIIKMTLRKKPVSLGELAERRYSTKNAREIPSFRKLQVRLRDSMLWRMRDLGLWSVDVLMDGERVKGYAISAGPVLWIYHKKIYIPWRKRQLSLISEVIGVED